MAIYLLYLTRELALSPAMVGVIFGFGGGVGVLVGSAAASSLARLFGLGRTLVTAHLLFGVLGILLALAVVWPSIAAQFVFASEFAGLSVNAIYMVNRVSVEQVVTPPHLRGRVQASRTVAHAISAHWGSCLVVCWLSELISAPRSLLASSEVYSRFSGCGSRPSGASAIFRGSPSRFA